MNTVKTIIAVAVAIIMVGSLTVPIIMDATNGDVETFINGGVRASEPTTNIIGSFTNPEIVVNGEEIALPPYSSPIMTDTFWLGNNADAANLFYTVNGTGVYRGNVISFDFEIDVTSKTLELTNIVHKSGVYDDVTIPFGWCAVVDVDGDLAIARTNVESTLYFQDFSKVRIVSYADGKFIYSLDGNTVLNGSVDDTVTYTNPSVKIGDFDAYSITVSSSSGVNFGETYGYANVYIVPYAFTVVSDSAGSEVLLLLAIPTILIVALALVLVRGFVKY